jgi:Uma2 family endonuclease
MATITTTPPSAAVRSNEFYRITVDQYERMLETGILRDGDPIELIDGMLVSKMPKSPEHGSPIRKLSTIIPRMLTAGWTWSAQEPIRIPDYDEPEPDFAVLAGSHDDYDHRHPIAGEIAIVVEVAVSSLADDRGIMLETYATAGIPVYWIVNVKDRQVEVYTQPQPAAYGSHVFYKTGQRFPVVIDGNQVGEIAVEDILPTPAAGNGE